MHIKERLDQLQTVMSLVSYSPPMGRVGCYQNFYIIDYFIAITLYLILLFVCMPDLNHFKFFSILYSIISFLYIGPI